MGRGETKKCGCGAVHDAQSWSALAHGGFQVDEFERLEYRHCRCGSTLARVVEVYKTEDDS